MRPENCGYDRIEAFELLFFILRGHHTWSTDSGSSPPAQFTVNVKVNVARYAKKGYGGSHNCVTNIRKRNLVQITELRIFATEIVTAEIVVISLNINIAYVVIRNSLDV